MRKYMHVMIFVLTSLTAFQAGLGGAARAGEFAFETIRLRGGVSGGSPLGRERQSDFNQIDLAATVRLPWEKELGGGWVLGTRMLASIGALRGGGETNGIMTVVPLDIVLGRKDGLVAIDMGGGGALLSDSKFGRQNFGGPFQFVWTFGITSHVAGPLGVGYHFQHYSDATLYGQDSRGVDLHLIELIYWFDRRD
ncbi:MAG: acyloxyacyl hydrolase [Nitrospirota bacterium]